MTTFLDVRAQAGGGDVSSQVYIGTGTALSNYGPLPLSGLLDFIHGKDVLIGTHGFNVNRQGGIEDFAYWESLLSLPPNGVFVGLLWPGDSESLHALSYPAEPRNATASGNMVADFVNRQFGNAASVSFVSHSLGARVALQAVSRINRQVRRLILMAGAIGDDCLTKEFASVPANVEIISAIASREDAVLRWAFPIGDLVAEIVGRSHPWWESALGRFGPSPAPRNFQPPFQVPDAWDYGHGDYLQTQPPAPGPLSPPAEIPASSGWTPFNGSDGWEEAWSAGFVSTRFR
jgi:pimeloyl-ACP methyl ester carboxylesterase